MDCNCPDDGILIEIPTDECNFDMKQIQKIAFATKGNVVWDSAVGDGTGLLGLPQVDSQVDTLADWEARLTAVDNTKMIVTPFIGGDPIIETGEAITSGGGDNSTLNGIEEVEGVNPSKFSCMFKSLTPAQERALKAIMCKTTEVYFFLEGGLIACVKPDLVSKIHRGFYMESFFFSDRNNQGFGQKDEFNMSFSMPSGWSEHMEIVTPLDFNPLYDL